MIRHVRNNKKMVSSKVNFLLNRKLIRKSYSDLEEKLRSLRDRPVLLAGASSSVLELERLSQVNKLPSKYIVIGCNWTNFLDIKIDFFVSSYYLMCQFAAERSDKVEWVLNASEFPIVRDKRITPIKRKNFGKNPALVMESYVSNNKALLYTNQNVMFLMLSLAYCIRPSSITLCGFESPDADPEWTHFFSGSKRRLGFMMDEFMKIAILKNSSKEIKGDSAKEVRDFIYRYFWCDSSISGCKSISSDIRARTMSLAKKREANLKKYLKVAEKNNIPHYRLGATTLFSGLPPNTELT